MKINEVNWTKWVKEYLERDVVTIEVIADPHAHDVFAVKAKIHAETRDYGSEYVVFFLATLHPSPDSDDGILVDLEEVEFTTWPPTSRW